MEIRQGLYGEVVVRAPVWVLVFRFSDVGGHAAVGMPGHVEASIAALLHLEQPSVCATFRSASEPASRSSCTYCAHLICFLIAVTSANHIQGSPNESS